jgi:hypothetical protein
MNELEVISSLLVSRRGDFGKRADRRVVEERKYENRLPGKSQAGSLCHSIFRHSLLSRDRDVIQHACPGRARESVPLVDPLMSFRPTERQRGKRRNQRGAIISALPSRQIASRRSLTHTQPLLPASFGMTFFTFLSTGD